MNEPGANVAGSEETRRLVYAFSKNRREEVRAEVGDYRGHEVIDIRVWALQDDGEKIPTRKGLTLRVDRAEELLAAVEALAKAVRAA